MNDVMLDSLRTYWERLRAGRIAPYRAEVDPRQFETALENMFIIERIDPENLRIRLSGMKISELMGMEVRGMEAGFLVEDGDRLRFERLLNVVMSEPAVVELQLVARGRVGPYRATMLLMPLRSDFGDINRVLGCASGPAEGFVPPALFQIEEVSVTPVEQNAAAEPVGALPGFAEEQAAFQPAPGAGAAPPRLRAIEGNPDAVPAPRDGAPKLRVIDND